MKCIYIPFCTIITFVTFFSINCESIDGSGIITLETRTLETFAGIELADNFIVTVDINNSLKPTATIETDDNLIDYISTEVSNNKLVIKKSSGIILLPSNEIQIHITTNNFPTNMDISGSGELLWIADTPLTTDVFEADISGSGKLAINAVVEQFQIDMSGSGKENLLISAESISTDISASGQLKIEGTTDSYSIAISGSGEAYLNVLQLLTVDISGSGTVYYLGNPTINSDISGSGGIFAL